MSDNKMDELIISGAWRRVPDKPYNGDHAEIIENSSGEKKWYILEKDHKSISAAVRQPSEYLALEKKLSDAQKHRENLEMADIEKDKKIAKLEYDLDHGEDHEMKVLREVVATQDKEIERLTSERDQLLAWKEGAIRLEVSRDDAHQECGLVGESQAETMRRLKSERDKLLSQIKSCLHDLCVFVPQRDLNDDHHPFHHRRNHIREVIIKIEGGVRAMTPNERTATNEIFWDKLNDQTKT